MRKRDNKAPATAGGWSITRAQCVIGAVIFVFCSVVVVGVTWHYSRELAMDQAREKAEIILSHTVGTHRYFSNYLKPYFFNEVPEATNDYSPVWMSSTYAVRSINNDLRDSGYGYLYKSCAINARSPEYEADPFEREVIRRFGRKMDMDTYSTVRKIDGESYLNVFLRGDTMSEDCMRCHSDPDLAPAGLVEQYGPVRGFHRDQGELSAAFSVRIPLAHVLSQATALTVRVSVIICALFVVSMVTLYFFNRKAIISPLKDITRGLDSMRRGAHENSELKLPFLHEFRQLVESFNALSDTRRQELNSTRSDLDEVIDETREQLEVYRSLFARLTLPCLMLETEDGGVSFYLSMINPAAEEQLGRVSARYREEVLPEDEGGTVRAGILDVWRNKITRHTRLKLVAVDGEVQEHDCLLLALSGGAVGVVVGVPESKA